jgi:hypothetical protein
MSQPDRVGNRVFHFRKTENLSKKKSEMKHRADAGERRRTRGAQNANSLGLDDYGFLTNVAV